MACYYGGCIKSRAIHYLPAFLGICPPDNQCPQQHLPTSNITAAIIIGASQLLHVQFL